MGRRASKPKLPKTRKLQPKLPQADRIRPAGMKKAPKGRRTR